jgi:hypothetical protein
MSRPLNTSIQSRVKKLETEILRLEGEWDKLDSLGRCKEQHEVEEKLGKMNKELGELKLLL